VHSEEFEIKNNIDQRERRLEGEVSQTTEGEGTEKKGA
jgi:hypothetical protein